MATPADSDKRASGIDIDAWTSSTAASLARLSLTPASALPLDPSADHSATAPNAAFPRASVVDPVSNPLHPSSVNVVRGTQPSLTIALDDSTHLPTSQAHHATQPHPSSQPQPLRRKSSNRDSLRRREALLLGKPGSRRRRQYENSRLISNPYAVPPEPGDWEIRPMYARREVPYAAAGLWEEKYKLVANGREERVRREREDGKRGLERLSRGDRERLKRCNARGLLANLEACVRDFVADWEAKSRKGANDGLPRGRGRGDSFVDVGAESCSGSENSSDEEVVFVGRRALEKAHLHDDRRRKGKNDALGDEKLVLDSLEDDAGARFGRWLIHALATYYDLRAWSVTTNDDPAHREAYVGIKPSASRDVKNTLQMPRPLWVMV
ncbi:MAG: hypothetical protein Q9159_001406 [Coniocarpon cinnabarinum]